LRAVNKNQGNSNKNQGSPTSQLNVWRYCHLKTTICLARKALKLTTAHHAATVDIQLTFWSKDEPRWFVHPARQCLQQKALQLRVLDVGYSDCDICTPLPESRLRSRENGHGSPTILRSEHD
jgi:hypothetical protein